MAEWMGSLEASPVRISASLASGPESTESGADCGGNMPGLLGRFDPHGYSLRTSQVCLLTNQCDEYSETFPRSGTMRSGRVYERATLGRRIGESGCSSWPTPQTTETDSEHFRPSRAETGRTTEYLGRMVQQWPTPRGTDGEKGGPNQRGSSGDLMFPSAASQWKTPHGMGNVDASGKAGGAGGGEFAKQANQWRTPSAGHPDKGGPQNPEKRLVGGHTMDLQDQVTTWPTPSARDHKSGDASQETLEKNARPLNEMAQVFSRPNPVTQKPGVNCWCGNLGCDLPSHKRRLNPYFVEILMGLPLNWTSKTVRTDCGVSGTPSYHSRVRSRLQFYLSGFREAPSL